MLYYIAIKLQGIHIIFNLIRYLSFRTVMGATTGFIAAFLICPFLIKVLQRKGWVSQIREDVPEKHLKKRGTPTMGGIAIIAGVIAGTVLWSEFLNPYVLMTLFATILVGSMGFIDDYIKDVVHKPKGLIAKYKLYGQLIVGIAIGLMVYLFPVLPEFRSSTELPFVKNVLLQLSVFYVFFVALVIIATSNAVNITDGLDGLAPGLIAIVATAFTAVAYVSGRKDFTGYLNILHLPGSGELSIFTSALAGSALGFLYYNSFPAQIFMGDTGSLACGTALAVVSVLLKKEFMLLIAGGVFVIETLSVIIQVIFFRKTGGRRLFKMAPIHHHFELSGVEEPKVVIRFWIWGVIFALLGLVLFKVR